jgi:hypothetical protein
MALVKKCLDELKKGEIIDQLKELGLPTQGRKMEFQSRLRLALEGQGIDVEAHGFEVVEGKQPKQPLKTIMRELREQKEREKVRDEERRRERLSQEEIKARVERERAMT